MSKYLAYSEYKDSGTKWLGNIPKSWQFLKLKYVAELEGDKVETSHNLNYVGLENVQSGNGKYVVSDRAKPEGLSTSFTGGDVLFGKLRPYLAKSWLADFDGICSSEFLVLRSHKITPKFLNYYTLTEEFINQVNSSTYGSKMPRANWDFISLMGVPLPPYDLSDKIAKFLDHETAKIDTLIDKQQQLIKLLKEKRQAVISHAVTKGLNPDVPMKESGIEWLGEVPEHWVVGAIKQFAEIESGHTPDKKKEEYWNDCHIPWVSLNDSKTLKVVDYIEDTKYKVNELGIQNSSARLLPANAVVFTRDASIGLSAITTRPMAVSQHIIAWLCYEDLIKPEFLLLIFYAMHEEFERYTFGATIKTIGMDDVKSLRAAIPSLEEQKAIIDEAFETMSTMDAAIEKAESLVVLLKERRTALISAAVTGKIDVRNWNPISGEATTSEPSTSETQSAQSSASQGS